MGVGDGLETERNADIDGLVGNANEGNDVNAPAIIKPDLEPDRIAIPGLDGLYEACFDGRIYSTRSGKWLTPAPARGYLVVTISVRGKCKVCKVHRLVASAWIPNPLGLPQVNHLDGIKAHNHINNLEWADASRQQLHARELGLVKTTDAMRAASSRNISGVSRAQRKLTDAAAASIRESKLSCAAMARAHGVSTSAIHAIRKGKTYAK